MSHGLPDVTLQSTLRVVILHGLRVVTSECQVISHDPSVTSMVYLTGVYLLDFFCSGIQFYLLLSPYLCFISLLYLDLYVLGDDALIS